MKVITVRQPWAWAIIHGGKDVENRTRNIVGSYRGTLGIHVSKTPACKIGETVAGADVEFERDRGGYLARSERFARPYRLPVDMPGQIIGTVEVVGVHSASVIDGCGRLAHDCPEHGTCRHHCSPWGEGPAPTGWYQHIMLANPKPFDEPIPAKGRLGLWNWSPND